MSHSTKEITVTVSSETYEWLEEAGQKWGAFMGDSSVFSLGEPISPEATAAECIERMREQVENSKEPRT